MAPKKKQEKMALGDFLTNQSLGSWADEMDSQPLPSVPASSYGNRSGDSGGGYGERRAFSTQQSTSSSSWGADRAQRGGMGDRGASYDRPRFSEREQLPLPDKPPYTAHLGNLAFDVTQADITGFLAECNVTSIRIVEDKLDQKPKGFGYVEFSTLDGLKKALTLTDTQFMGRPIRISVAEPPKERADTRDFSDWSRKGPLPDLASQGRQPSRGFRGAGSNFDDRSDAGSERGGNRRQGYFQDDGKVRDLGNWERKGPLSPAPGAGPPDARRTRDGPPRERRPSPSWGEGRAEGESRPRREFQERPPAVERVPTAAEQDNQWRARMKPDPSPAPTPDASTPSSPQPQAVKERPKLNLAKRTVSTQDPEAMTPSGDSKASPFGAAKAVDTAAREREVEEKRQIAIRQKKEADDKAKEEKAARDSAAKAEKVTSPTNENGPRRGPRQQQQQQQQQQNGTKNAKENGDAAPQREKPNFSILRRDADGGNDEQEEYDTPDASAHGQIIGDRETKPQEIVRDAAASKEEDAPETTAEKEEEAGWSTVATKQKNNRRGGARALAS